MGTLTANDVRLPGYCDHKLPTSCRLTSIPECCACADERAHSAAYSTYIDGVGYVQRGTRWQRYCWFCKEFWENRVVESGLRPGQTRIPEVPDQTLFLERWYDFHRGYRLTTNELGEEVRTETVGEDLKDVPPGQLPRTSDELGAGQTRSVNDTRAADIVPGSRDISQPSIESILDGLFVEVLEEDAQTQRQSTSFSPRPDMGTNTHAQTIVPLAVSTTRNTEREQRRVATLRRELVRMRNGIERVIGGLRELGETIPDHAFASNRLERLGQTLDDIAGPSPLYEAMSSLEGSVNSQPQQRIRPLQDRIDEARGRLQEAQHMQQQAASEMHTVDEEVRLTQRQLQHLQREQRTTENYVRLFGTREEVQAQGENYESPIGGMFNRAWERFRAAEEVRQEERTLRQVLADEGVADNNEDDDIVRRLQQLTSAERDVWNVPRPPRTVTPEAGLTHQDTSNTTQLMEMARDEVFSGQQTSQTEERLSNDGLSESDDALGRYYNALRRQGWNQTHDASRQNDYPQMMLSAHPTRLRSTPSNIEHATIAELDGSYRQSFRPALESTDVTSRSIESGMRASILDAQYLLHKIVEDSLGTLARSSTGELSQMTPHIERMAAGREDAMENFDLHVLSDEDLVWATSLPAERARRAREDGQPLMLTDNVLSEHTETRRRNIEAMAEAFQMSAEVRRSSRCSAPEQLRMLYRLQRGDRSADDRGVLWQMLANSDSVLAARRVLVAQAYGYSSAELQRLADIQEERMEASRAGQHSRQDLHDMRQTTSALAVAAGRTAMQAGPQAVIQRLLDMHSEIREDASMLPEIDSNQGLQITGFRSRLRRSTAASSSSSEFSGEDDRAPSGLDAPDSGRPEPKSDEDMTMKLECKICFSQLADIACLPCGHLVMCRWCSDQHSPVFNHDRTRPRRPALCPSCRKQIKQKVRVYCA